MYDLITIKKGCEEFIKQAHIIKDTQGGGGFIYLLLDMFYCLLRYGARPLDYWRFEFYKKNHRARNRYETFYRQKKLIKYMQKSVGIKTIIADNKEWEYETYKKYIVRDWLLIKPTDSDDLLKQFLSKYSYVFAKPVSEALGRGARIVDCNNRKDVQQLIVDRKDKSFLIEECLENLSEIKRVNPTSLNTLRVFSLIDKKGNPYIFEILFRAGKDNLQVDNWGQGGIVYHVDIETGIIDRPGLDKYMNHYIIHPGSNIQMVGFKIPNISNIKEYICKLALVVPKAKIVGWDIALTPDGIDFIEMNCPGGHDIMQAFGEPFYDLIIKNIR